MKMVKRFITCFLLCLISILIVSIVSGYCIHHQQTASSMQILLKAHYWQLAIWRYMVFGLVLWYWPELIVWMGKYRQWSVEIVQYFSKQRIPVAIFFALFELLIVHNSFGYVVSHLL